ncbi:hypothetical protein IWX90DRAFT_99529 [Phyllosticta citrichinensis]|uniref:Transmembrane protein n=1 Tax=Phyllosticta citrichinensis TaxID=1130410 RepID=A0ABR1Y279_9PEZI
MVVEASSFFDSPPTPFFYNRTTLDQTSLHHRWTTSSLLTESESHTHALSPHQHSSSSLLTACVPHHPQHNTPLDCSHQMTRTRPLSPFPLVLSSIWSLVFSSFLSSFPTALHCRTLFAFFLAPSAAFFIFGFALVDASSGAVDEA